MRSVALIAPPIRAELLLKKLDSITISASGVSNFTAPPNPVTVFYRHLKDTISIEAFAL